MSEDEDFFLTLQMMSSVQKNEYYPAEPPIPPRVETISERNIEKEVTSVLPSLHTEKIAISLAENDSNMENCESCSSTEHLSNAFDALIDQLPVDESANLLDSSSDLTSAILHTENYVHSSSSSSSSSDDHQKLHECGLNEPEEYPKNEIPQPADNTLGFLESDDSLFEVHRTRYASIPLHVLPVYPTPPANSSSSHYSNIKEEDHSTDIKEEDYSTDIKEEEYPHAKEEDYSHDSHFQQDHSTDIKEEEYPHD